MATYSNLGIKLITTGDEASTWGTSTNDNFELFDTAIVGHATVILPAAGSSGSPNALPVTDFTASDGRNRTIEFTDAGDLGADAYVQITPNDFEGYWFIKNSLSNNRSIYVFQGTYNSGRDYVIPGYATVVVRCTGTGATSYIYNILDNFNINSIVPNSGTTFTLFGALSVNGAISTNNNKITNLASPTVGTDAATKSYVDAAGSIVFASGDQILFRGASVPSGWSIVAQNDKALRIVSGTPSSGGATAFSSAFNASITSGAGGSHSHTYSGTTSTVASGPVAASGGAAFTVATNGHSHTFSGTTSTASTHTHTVTTPNLAYYDMNLIQKT